MTRKVKKEGRDLNWLASKLESRIANDRELAALIVSIASCGIKTIRLKGVPAEGAPGMLDVCIALSDKDVEVDHPGIALEITKPSPEEQRRGVWESVRFIVEGTSREAAPAELMAHGFHVRPEGVDRVASLIVNGIENDNHRKLRRMFGLDRRQAK